MSDDRKNALLIVSLLRTHASKGKGWGKTRRNAVHFDFSRPAESMLSFKEMAYAIHMNTFHIGEKTEFALLLGVPEKSKLSSTAIRALVEGYTVGDYLSVLPEDVKACFPETEKMEEIIKTKYPEAYKEFEKWEADPVKYFKNDLTKKQLDLDFNPSQLRVLAEVAPGEVGAKAHDLGMKPILHAQKVRDRQETAAVSRSTRLFE